MKFFTFEIRYWLRQPMVYVFFLINTLIIFGATYSDNIRVGGSFGNIYKNAPFVIQNYYAVMSYITLLMTTSFILASTVRDFSYNTWQILFTTPVKRAQYLLGRFFGAMIISVIPMLGISLGIILACVMPGMDVERTGPFIASAHTASLLYIAIPNTLFSAAVVFMIAALTRNTIAAFMGSVLLLMITGIASSFASDLEKEWLSVLMDPYGASTFSILTKYWTVSQKNTMVLPAEGLFLINRLLWIGISSILVIITVRMFSFTEKTKKKYRPADNDAEGLVPAHLHKPLPAVTTSFTPGALSAMLFARIRYELKGIIKSPTFIVLLFAGLLNFIPNIIANTGAYGLSAHPVTYDLINMIEGTFYTFLIAIIIIYSGLLVWKERENKIDEIYDATPHPTWISFASKFISMAVLIAIVQVVCIVSSMTIQLAKGFTDTRPDVYLKSLMVIDYSGFLFLVVMSMLIHSFVNNKYIAFFAFIVFLILNNFTWTLLEVESNMVQYGGRPSYMYSDMNGFGPYLKGIAWFRIYWGLAALLFAFISIFAWNRGKEFTLRRKLTAISQGVRGRTGKVLISVLVLWLITAGFVYYNTQILNAYDSSQEQEEKQVAYEKQFKKYEDIPQPRIIDLRYSIDLYPSSRKAVINATWWVKNKSAIPVDSIHFTLPQQFIVILQVPDARLIADHKDLKYLIYRLDQPLAPGDSMRISFTSEYAAKGFENEVRFTSIVDNGSFFNNTDFSPKIGYQPGLELQDRDDRKKYGLKEIDRMPKLERNCHAHCMNTYLDNHSDWVQVETFFGTDGDQVAVAPGSLVRKWKENGRNYFHYKLDHTSLNFYSFISARYQVLRSKHRGIDVEVYYDGKHEYNVENMERSMKKSLDYYMEHFGLYYHKQVRIIEFPRYASFAQAFPGTMPYSESIGFIAKIEDENDIDMVFYVVAHEMAHQYWAHQLISAGMQGATLLTETFAQYSALMVMEKEYGRDAMKKFLKYEMDDYLRSRGTEQLKELPLMYVENQGYVHYNKGSLVMYYLREMIGEENVNRALRKLLADHAYKEPPYPTAHHAVDAFRESTPDSIKYIIHDLFETITLFSNRVTDASAKPLPDGKYELTLEFTSQKFRADSLGGETEIPVNDWIEIGVFGEPEAGKKTGPVLYRRKHHISQAENTITLVTDRKPDQAGIDPMNLMVDLVGDDNIKKVDED
jgi:ABC-type transport system involved in multi-copper enzyme maturation permease subunit